MATITPLDAVLGAEISGVDIGAGVDDTLMRTLIDALYAHRVIVIKDQQLDRGQYLRCLLYTSPSPRDGLLSRMPSSA